MKVVNFSRRGWLMLAVASLIAGLGLAAGAGVAGPAVAATAATGTAPAAPPHIMTIMMENTDYSMVTGSAYTPYLNQLEHQYADFTQAYGWRYSSLPNYITLLAGTDGGITGDCDINSCGGLTNPTLMDQLEQAGITWNAYEQGDPSGCYDGDANGFASVPPDYAFWHNAFRYFADFSEQCQYIDDFSDLLPNLNSPHAADLQWVVPDLMNDDDSSSTQAGDSWLNAELPKIMASTWYKQGGQILITYDTGYGDVGERVGDTAGLNGSSGGHIAVVVVSARDKGMGAVDTPVNTAGMLRSIEQAYGVPYLAGAADPANGSLGGALVSGRPTGAPPRLTSHGAVLSVTGSRPDELSDVPGTLAVNGIAEPPGGGGLIEVGENQAGEGVVVAPGRNAVAVPGTATLESVACTTSVQCYAVGFATDNTDVAVLVSIRAGKVAAVTPVTTFVGLEGIACPTSSTCYAVGTDSTDDVSAVTTITDGTAGTPAEVPGDVAYDEAWFNAIACPTATQCYASGYTGPDYDASITPVTSGQPAADPVDFPAPFWYIAGLSCPSVGTCVAVGENNSQQGIVGTLADGALGTTTVVPGTEFLYGVACQHATDCLLTGAGTPAADGYSSGVVVPLTAGVTGKVTTIAADTNGFGQVIPDGKDAYLTVGAAY